MFDNLVVLNSFGQIDGRCCCCCCRRRRCCLVVGIVVLNVDDVIVIVVVVASYCFRFVLLVVVAGCNIIRFDRCCSF